MTTNRKTHTAGLQDEADALTTNELYSRALAGGAVSLRTCAGRLHPLEASRWVGKATPADLSMLDQTCGSVLDVGCGPGRLLVALSGRGIPALGIDVAAAAIRSTERAGVLALQRSVFSLVPAGWGTVLLADGNIGIGGDPTTLLRRVRQLLRPGGRLVVELAPPGGRTRRSHLRLEADGSHGGWFLWSQVPQHEMASLCVATSFVFDRSWHVVEPTGTGQRTRWFGTAHAEVA